MSYYTFLDTSVVLNRRVMDSAPHPYISTITLQELEKIKNDSNKSDEIKYQARVSLRKIIADSGIESKPYNLLKINKTMHKYRQVLLENNDSRLIAEAICLMNDKHKIEFWTMDAAQYSLASSILGKDKVVLWHDDNKQAAAEYFGWKEVTPTEDEFSSVYSNPKINTFQCVTNEFVKLYENKELKDVLFWSGEEYTRLKYRNFTSPLGERVAPRNTEQKMLMHLLQDKNMPVKIVTGGFGSGKSYLTLMYALDEIGKGRFDKLVFVKNNLEAKGAGKLGVLPGGEIEKLLPWLMQISDIIGEDLFNQYLEEKIIEPVHLSGIRGRTFKNAIIFADESENFLKTNIQLLISRVGENSEIIICGDQKQNDYRNPEDSGFLYAIDRLKGNSNVGVVKLIKTERSPIAALADYLD